MLIAYITGMATSAAAFILWAALGHWKRLDRALRVEALAAVAQDTCDLWATGYEDDLRMTRQITQLHKAIQEVTGE
jgi:hypothetical protein